MVDLEDELSRVQEEFSELLEKAEGSDDGARTRVNVPFEYYVKAMIDTQSELDKLYAFYDLSKGKNELKRRLEYFDRQNTPESLNPLLEKAYEVGEYVVDLHKKVLDWFIGFEELEDSRSFFAEAEYNMDIFDREFKILKDKIQNSNEIEKFKAETINSLFLDIKTNYSSWRMNASVLLEIEHKASVPMGPD